MKPLALGLSLPALVFMATALHCGSDSDDACTDCDGDTDPCGGSVLPGEPCTAGAQCGQGCGACSCSSSLVWECTNCPTDCPSALPASGDACSPEGLHCEYPCSGGASSPTDTDCVDGAWQISAGLGQCPVCSPACSGAQICCEEPTHLDPDAGPPTAPICVDPQDNGACPLLP